MNNLSIYTRWVLWLFLALGSLTSWGQTETDLTPYQLPSGRLLICRCDDLGKYVEYAETQEGNAFYLSSIGSHSKKAPFDNDITVNDIVYGDGMVYFCGHDNLGQGVVGQFDVNGLFAGSSNYGNGRLE